MKATLVIIDIKVEDCRGRGFTYVDREGNRWGIGS